LHAMFFVILVQLCLCACRKILFHGSNMVCLFVFGKGLHQFAWFGRLITHPEKRCPPPCFFEATKIEMQCETHVESMHACAFVALSDCFRELSRSISGCTGTQNRGHQDLRLRLIPPTHKDSVCVRLLCSCSIFVDEDHCGEILNRLGLCREQQEGAADPFWLMLGSSGTTQRMPQSYAEQQREDTVDASELCRRGRRRARLTSRDYAYKRL
jgi:hypothetical protein